MRVPTCVVGLVGQADAGRDEQPIVRGLPHGRERHRERNTVARNGCELGSAELAQHVDDIGREHVAQRMRRRVRPRTSRREGVAAGVAAGRPAEVPDHFATVAAS